MRGKSVRFSVYVLSCLLDQEHGYIMSFLLLFWLGELMMPSSSGMSFTPHLIVVSIGEVINVESLLQKLSRYVSFVAEKLQNLIYQDIASRVIAFYQQVDNVWRVYFPPMDLSFFIFKQTSLELTLSDVDSNKGVV